MSNPTPPKAEPIIPQIETLITDLLRIRSAAREVEALLTSALGSATHNPEYEEIRRKVESFQKALEVKQGPTDAELLNGLEGILSKAFDSITLEIDESGDCYVFSGRSIQIGIGSSLRQALERALEWKAGKE